jgi:hemoglobin/transferrin/lactoferrin receptor protein
MRRIGASNICFLIFVFILMIIPIQQPWALEPGQFSKAQKIVDDLLVKYSDLVRLTIHAVPLGEKDSRIIACNIDEKIGAPSDPEDLEVMKTNKIIVLKEGDKLDVTAPVRDKAGRAVAATGITLPLRKGETEEEVAEKAQSIAQELSDAIQDQGLAALFENRSHKLKEIVLGETIVTATRTPRGLFDLSRSVTVADQEEIRRKNRLSVLDTLDDKIGMWVEKRTTTTSDPVIRGLSGGNLLALIDGNSLTTLWGEGGFAGDDMYGKVDAESIERMEVVRGPASVMYGSNALGGVINFLTKRPPIDFAEEGFALGGKVKGAYGSAAQYGLARFENWGATPSFRYIIGLSLRDVRDMRAGGDVGEISPSGGEDHNLDFRGEYHIFGGHFLDLSGQYVERPEVYRSYRPTQVNRNDRKAVSLGYRAEDEFRFSDAFEWRAYYQDKKDTRTWTDREKSGVALWETFSTDMVSTKDLGSGHILTWGLHYHVDYGESPDDEQFTITTADTGTQKASPDTEWHNYGVYVQDEWDLGERFTLNGNIRYDDFRFRAEDNVFYTIPGSTDPENVAARDPGDYDKDSVTGGIGLVLHATENLNFVSSWYRGYRLFPPNFGLRQLGYGLLAPNGLLDPIIGDTYEVGARVSYPTFSGSLTTYYTDFKDFQQPVPGSYNGMTYFDFDGSGIIEPDERIYEVASNGDAYVKGVEIELAFDLARFHENLNGFSVAGGFMWNKGEQEFPGEDEEPLRHTHPMRGLVKLHWEDPDPETGRWLEFVADMIDRFDEVSDDRLNSDVGYLNDPQDPDSGLLRDYGLPGYSVFHIRGGLSLSENLSMVLAMENILDKLYRTAHSRMDATGRNFRIGLEWRY